MYIHRRTGRMQGNYINKNMFFNMKYTSWYYSDKSQLGPKIEGFEQITKHRKPFNLSIPESGDLHWNWEGQYDTSVGFACYFIVTEIVGYVLNTSLNRGIIYKSLSALINTRYTNGSF